MVADIKIADLERIKDPDRNMATVRALRAWIEAGKPAGEPPRSPKGDPSARFGWPPEQGDIC